MHQLCCSVNVSELKTELIEALDSLREAILIALRERVMQSSSSLIEMYQKAEAEVSKVSSTGEEVLALKRTIQKEQLQQERMRDTIQRNKDTVAFLVSHQLPISQEVSHRNQSILFYFCTCALKVELICRIWTSPSSAMNGLPKLRR